MEKIVIITGANRGIGKAISFYFAGRGYRCLLVSRSGEKLEALANEIRSKYKNAPEPELYACDFLHQDQVYNTLTAITSKHNSIDVLVNNAGMYLSGGIENSLGNFKDIFEVNLNAPFLFLKAIVPLMKKQREGYIFNIASRAAKIGFEGSGAYSSSKFALLGLSESLYRELSKENIRITAICPSYVNTEMAFEAGAKIKAEEMIQTEDIANTLNYLMNLTQNAFVKEVVIECQTSII